MLKIRYITINSIIGILIGYCFKRCDLIISLLFCIICLIICFFIINYLIRNKNIAKFIKIYFSITMIFTIYTIYKYTSFNNQLLSHINIDNQNIVIGKIVNFEKETDYYNVYNFRIQYINNKKVGSNIYIYLPKTNNYCVGDYLKSIVEIEFPNEAKNDGGFNNKLYLFSNNIQGYGYAKNTEIILNSNNKLLMFINNYKKECINKINANLDSDTASILISIIYADKSYLSNEIKQIFSDANLSHVLNVSGSSITYIIAFLMLITNQISPRKRNIIIGILITIYLSFIDLSISLIRFIIIYLINYIYKLCKQRINNIDTVFLALLIFLIYNPLMLFNSSIILSFICVLSMKLLYKMVNYRLQYVFNSKNNYKKRKIIDIVSMTFSIYIITLPIITIYFNKIYIISLFSNIFALPILHLILVFSFMFLFIYKVPILSNLFTFILLILVKVLIILAKFFSFIPFSSITMFPFNFIEIIIYYFIIYTIYINNNYYFMIKSILKQFIIKYKQKLIIFLIIILLIFSLFIYFDVKTLKINFIDVGQGDCTLIRVNNKTILIDGGGNNSDFDVGERILVPYLLNKRILKIDYVIISHFDTDHCRGLISVINKLNVKNIVVSEFVEKSDEYYYFFNNIKKKDINIIKIKSSDRINLDKEVNIHFLSPWENYSDIDNRENNLSIVCKLNYYNISCLFTGDIDNIMEEKIINKYKNLLRSDILKIGHHGSKSSTSQEFLEVVSPKVGLIGVGKNNYGHPNKDVLTRLEKIRYKNI